MSEIPIKSPRYPPIEMSNCVSENTMKSKTIKSHKVESRNT